MSCLFSIEYQKPKMTQTLPATGKSENGWIAQLCQLRVSHYYYYIRIQVLYLTLKTIQAILHTVLKTLPILRKFDVRSVNLK